ncbi:MAG TPA: hypothetical protein VEK34_06685, partial [Methylocella sp.]|nr:hypothetical protein [Methylocella sp.]
SRVGEKKTSFLLDLNWNCFLAPSMGVERNAFAGQIEEGGARGRPLRATDLLSALTSCGGGAARVLTRTVAGDAPSGGGKPASASIKMQQRQ